MFGKSVEVTVLQDEVARLKEANGLLQRTHTLDKEKISDLELTVRGLNDSIKSLEWKMSCQEKEFQLARDKAINELRLSMQESLIKSDLIRTEAVSKLEIYEKTDNKADSNAIKEMMKQLIEKIGAQGVSIVK